MNAFNYKNIRKCCVCDAQLYGRSDKVFCGIKCKNTYHGAVRRDNKSVSSTCIDILHKNYGILRLMMAKKCNRMVVKKLYLEKLKFNFTAITGIEKTPLGVKMKIFEFSWYFSKNDNIVVFQESEQSTISPFLLKRWEYHLKPAQQVEYETATQCSS